MKRDVIHRLVIAVLALGVIALSAHASRSPAARTALAQAVTDTPTPTPTLTPTITPTPSITPFGFVTSTPTPTWTPPFPFNSPLVTPTPTRLIRVVTEISSPQSGDAAAGLAPIFGTALVAGYRKFDLHIAPAGSENWQWLTTSQEIVHDGTLYLLDTTQFKDGYYDLRLRTINDMGEYVEAFLRGLEIRNANPPTATQAFDELGTPIPPPPVSPLGPPTPTPRPRIVQNIPNGQGIFAPEIGQTVAGPVDIVGTVNGFYTNPFARYEIALSPAGEGNWTFLYSGEQQMWQGVLYTLDSAAFADGYYDVRLRVVYRDANYDEYILRYLRIDNSGRPSAGAVANGIALPVAGATVRGITEFIGTALDPAFARWELAWSPAGQEQWAFLTSSERPALQETLARLDLSRLAGAQIDVRLRVVRQDGNYDDYTVRALQVAAP